MLGLRTGLLTGIVSAFLIHTSFFFSQTSLIVNSEMCHKQWIRCCLVVKYPVVHVRVPWIMETRKITSMHLYPRRWNVATQVAEELKTVTYATPPMEACRERENGHIRYPSYGGTLKERKKLSPPLKHSPTSHCSRKVGLVPEIALIQLFVLTYIQRNSGELSSTFTVDLNDLRFQVHEHFRQLR